MKRNIFIIEPILYLMEVFSLFVIFPLKCLGHMICSQFAYVL